MLSSRIGTIARQAARSARSLATGAFPPHVLAAPATEVSALKNGVRIASEGGHGETVTVGVFVDSGSRYETEATNGAAHFLEHICFKGTAKRTQQQLEEEIENMGGHLNAYTSREQTVYYAKVFKDDVDQAMDILSDLLLHSKLDEGAIERERSVILREAEEVSKDLEEVIFDKLHETAYMGSGLGRTILGTEQNIKSLTKADLQGYINTHYTGPRVVISAAGPVDHGELGVLAEKYFGELPGPSDASPSVLTEAPREPQPFVGSEIRVIDDAIGATHVALGFETGGWTDPHAFPLMVIQNMIGSWNRSVSTGPNLSSDIARTLASSGRAHSVSAFNTSYQDTGLMGVYYVTDPAYHVEGSEAVLGGLRDLYDATDAAAVERAKQQLKAGMLMQLDGTTAVMEDIGRSMLAYGRRMTPAEVFARVDAVTVDDVAAAARAVFYDKNYALATLGHHGEISDPEWWRDRVVNWLSR